MCSAWLAFVKRKREAARRGGQGTVLTVSDVRVVGLGQQGHDAGALLGDAHQQEAQVEDRCPADVIGDIADGKVEQPLDRCIVGGAAVGHSDGKYTPVPAP